MSVLLTRIGIILFLVSAYLLAKNLDNASGNTIKMFAGGAVLGIILFGVGVSSIEKYTDTYNEETENNNRLNNLYKIFS